MTHPRPARSLARTVLAAVFSLAVLVSFTAPVVARSAAAPQTIRTDIPLHAELVPNNPDYPPNPLNPAGQWGLKLIDAPQAWDVTLGSPNITVAVVDTGVWYTEPDIANNMWRNPAPQYAGTHGWNFLNSTPYPFDSDASSGTYHGTGVSGVIAAEINSGIEVAGVANIRLMALEALGPNGEGTSANTSLAIEWAADHGARVINLSLGTNTTLIGPTDIEQAVNYAWSKGALIVAAAGNSGSNSLDYPASLPNVVSVGAVDQNGVKAYFSNYANGLSLTAPGVNILTLNGGGNLPHNLDGTSLATPFVSGVAALLLSFDPSLTNVQLWNVLNETAVPPTGGYSAQYGWGIVNAWNAINALGKTFISVNSPPSTVAKGSSFSLAWSILGPSNLPITDTHVIWGTNSASLGNATAKQTGTTRANFTAANLAMPSSASSLYFQVVATVNGTDYHSPVYTVAASNLPDFLFVLYQFLSSNLLYLAIFILVLAAIVAFVPQRRARARRTAAYRTRTAAPPAYPYGPPPGPPPAPPATYATQTVARPPTQPPAPLEFVRPETPAAAPPTPAPPSPPVAAKKRCPNCGTLVNSDNMFCFFCGHPFR